MSKGSWQRPAQVTNKEVEDNWKRTFGTVSPAGRDAERTPPEPTKD